MISTIIISALLSLLNTDGLDKNSSLLTAGWRESLWALHVFWGWVWQVDVMLMKSDFKSHLGQQALQRKIFHTSALGSPSGKPEDATGHSRFRTNPLNHHQCFKKGLLRGTGRPWGKKCLKQAIRYWPSLCPVTSRSIPRTAQKRGGNKQGVKSWPGNL